MLRKGDRNKNNSLMGQELGEMFSDLHSQWAWVQYRWDNYMLLFNADGAKILDKLSGIEYIRHVMAENLINSVCSLLDTQPQTAKKIQKYINEHERYEGTEFAKEVESKINAAFMYLGDAPNNKDGDETPEMKKMVKKQENLLRENSIREFRNRRIAHRDPTFHNTAVRLIDASKLALDTTHDALKAIYEHHAQKALPRIVPSTHDRLPAQDLLKSLLELMQVHER